jgi:UDP-N-acetylglucosamine diphosphorylase / glucose-1-phosphate thymidylyltransferase / UDP-N-acetylgalactosamine diphosphorylase / glucosamine-1-phosphate N-acetyltransferase / galactosamine-1-phosphate N-acetyltransferase
MQIILFDNGFRKKLFPLTANRAVADIRIGMLQIKEWWALLTNKQVDVCTEGVLNLQYNTIKPGEYIWIDATVLPNTQLLQQIENIQLNEALYDEIGLVAVRKNSNTPLLDYESLDKNIEKNTLINNTTRLQTPQQIFQLNDAVLREQYLLVTKNRKSQPIPTSNKIIDAQNIFIEEGAVVEHSLLNASTGPIYIGRNATIMEGCIVRGPFAMCENAVLKMGTFVYGATTLGVHSIGGGEIKNSIIGDYSNKAHHGYLGDSVIGQWCNLGAGTTNSNIKNTAGEVKLWNYYSNTYEPASQKCGVIMGDYTKCAINSSINTASSFGVSCNVFGEGLLPTVLNNFAWGTQQKSWYAIDKAIKDIDNWKKLKRKAITEAEITILTTIFEATINQ